MEGVGAVSHGMLILMAERSVRLIGVALAMIYASFIVWLYVRQPQTLAEVTGGLTASVSAYRINQQAFDDGLALFRRDQFEASRAAFDRADPAGQDARTQFYIAYSYYRSVGAASTRTTRFSGKGLERVDKAIALAPGGRLIVEDPGAAHPQRRRAASGAG